MVFDKGNWFDYRLPAVCAATLGLEGIAAGGIISGAFGVSADAAVNDGGSRETTWPADLFLLQSATMRASSTPRMDGAGRLSVLLNVAFNEPSYFVS